MTRASECPARPSVTDGAQRWFSCNDDSGKERTCSRPEGERRSLVPAPGRRARSVWCPGRLAKGDGDWSPLREEPRTPRALPTGPALTLPQTEGQPHSRGLSAVRDCVPRDRNRSWVVFGAFLVAESLLQRRKSPLTRGRSEQPSHRPGGGCSVQAGGELEGQPPAGQGNACAPPQEALRHRRGHAQVSGPGCAAFRGGPETLNHPGPSVQSRTASWSPCPEQETLDKICFELLLLT